MDEDYIIAWMCMEEGTLLFKIPHLNPGKSNNPSTISHLDKPMKMRWRIQVKEDFKSWRQLLSAKGSATQYLWNCTFAFCPVSSFLLSASEAISPSISPPSHNREWCAIQQTDRKRDSQTDYQTDRSGGGWIIYAANHSSYNFTSQREREAGRQSKSDRGKEAKNRWGGREEEV